jgi:hypothetical protein
MSSTTILKRIRHLFASDSGEHLDSISHAFRQGRLKEPTQPMSDQELARAIREFQAVPVPDWTIAKLSQRLLDPAMPRDD